MLFYLIEYYHHHRLNVHAKHELDGSFQNYFLIIFEFKFYGCISLNTYLYLCLPIELCIYYIR